MKKLLGICVLIAIVAVFFTGCPLEDKDPVQERMNMFIKDANKEAWGDLKGHTHSDAAAYNQADAAFWKTQFSASIPLGNLSYNDTTVTFSGNGITYTAKLKQDEPDNYKIDTIAKGDTFVFE